MLSAHAFEVQSTCTKHDYVPRGHRFDSLTNLWQKYKFYHFFLYFSLSTMLNCILRSIMKTSIGVPLHREKHSDFLSLSTKKKCNMNNEYWFCWVDSSLFLTLLTKFWNFKHWLKIADIEVQFLSGVYGQVLTKTAIVWLEEMTAQVNVPTSCTFSKHYRLGCRMHYGQFW